MDGWTLAIFAVVAYFALSSLVVVMRRYRNSYETILPPIPKRKVPQTKNSAPTSDTSGKPAEAAGSNGEGPT